MGLRHFHSELLSEMRPTIQIYYRHKIVKEMRDFYNEIYTYQQYDLISAKQWQI